MSDTDLMPRRTSYEAARDFVTPLVYAHLTERARYGYAAYEQLLASAHKDTNIEEFNVN